MKFYQCTKCKNIITVLKGDNKNLTCCQDNLIEIKPNTQEAATEKHIPVCKFIDGQVEVTVGEIEHPMSEEHYIEFIVQATDKDFTVKKLNPDDKPIAVFPNKENAKYYAFCNIHGLWTNY